MAFMMQNSKPNVDVRAGGPPDWPELRSLATAQAGHFTTAQAGARGFSEQLLSKHAASGTFERRMRGIYRLADAPTAEHEELVVAWLWSGEIGTISHESALQVHDLSDALPARLHLTVPETERGRRRVVPEAYVLHFADLEEEDRTWIGPIRITNPARTVQDVAANNGDAGLVAQAIEQGIQRQIFRVWDLVAAIAYARSFDTPAWRVFPEAVEDLGGSWAMRAASGCCTRRPPADWPTLAREIAEGHKGRVYWQMFNPKSGTMGLHIAWPTPGPDAAEEDEIRREFAEAFAWR